MSPYVLSKSAGAHFVQLLANQTPREQLQVVHVHPGTVFAAGFAKLGITEDMLPFDQGRCAPSFGRYLAKKHTADLPGAFAVWAASEEAAFVHNRFVWAAWDVEELARGDVRKQIEEHENYLRIGVVGIGRAKRAKAL